VSQSVCAYCVSAACLLGLFALTRRLLQALQLQLTLLQHHEQRVCRVALRSTHIKTAPLICTSSSRQF